MYLWLLLFTYILIRQHIVFLDLFFMYINVSCILVFHNIGSSVEVVPKFDVHFKYCIKDNL
jgi:hypothetical protein